MSKGNDAPAEAGWLMAGAPGETSNNTHLSDDSLQDGRKDSSGNWKEEQARIALARANAVRYARARIKRQVKSGETTIADLLRDTPPEVNGVKVGELLCWTPRIGAKRAQAITHGITTMTIKVKDVGPCTRGKLLERLSA